ncbi:MAG TPA: hypothetical protein VFY65_08490 [Longimicrobium sp.]|nr:hypothetical protein [Longimicrobium sp.]
MTTERDAGPGPRKEVGGAASSQVHPPHVTENDEGAQAQESTQAPNAVPLAPANAHGKDLVEADKQVRQIDDESMYGSRPGEDKDRAKTDST